MKGVKNTVWIRILRLLYIAIKVYIKVSKYLDETASVARCFIQKAREGFLIKKNPTFSQMILQTAKSQGYIYIIPLSVGYCIIKAIFRVDETKNMW